MFLFNAFQLVLFFACGPFIVTYIKGAEFYAHIALFWVLLAAYLWGFGAITICVADNLNTRK